MYQVYKLTDPNGQIYVGVTRQKLSMRMASHRYKSNKIYPEFDFINCTLDILEKTNNPFEREKYWIDKIGPINKSKGGKGPSGIVFTEERKSFHADLCKKRLERGDNFLKNAWKKSLTSENQKIRALKSRDSYLKKHGYIYAKSLENQKIYGPFVSHRDAAENTWVHEDSVRLSIKNKKPKLGLLFYRGGDLSQS